MSKRKIIACDLFCGAGGTSTGLVRACRRMGIDVDLLAVNHWPTAIETHSKNHPDAKHICARLDQLQPEQVVPGGHLHLLVASPECTHHSRARGGKPMNDQSRASAWDILKWIDKLRVDNILIENVREFADWGPLNVDGRPNKRLKGSMFQAFIEALRANGYRVEYKVLNAANYGDATTRERLFIIARRNGRKIVWPEQTHAPSGDATLFKEQQTWRAAREIIDWTIPGKSIFTRKKPLAPATLRRIEAGLRKFGGKNAEPFLVVLRNNQTAASIDQPVPTITTSGANFALCEPFLLGQQSGSVARSLEDPCMTISTDGAIALCEPFIVPQFSEANPKSVDDPLGTITTTSRGVGLCQPFVVTVDRPETNRSAPRTTEDPLPTVTGSPRIGLVQPFIMSIDQAGSRTDRVRSIDRPMPTLTTKAHAALVEPFVVPFFGEREGQEPRTHSVNDPLPTVTGHGAGALVEPHIVEFYGNGQARSVNEPLPTVTTRDRFGIVEPEVTRVGIDIRFRMLQPHELAAAMGFPADYEFTGNREAVVKQIGNAVPGYLSEALCASLIGDYAQGRAA